MPDAKEGIVLKSVLTGLLQAVREAKRLGDLESAKLIEVYKKDKYLSAFPVPAFAISETEVELHFAVEEVTQTGGLTDIKINLAPEVLKNLDAHQVSTMKLKISPFNLRVFEESK